MKLKNVKVGQRVKIKKRVGYNNQRTFTLLESESRIGTVVSVEGCQPWEVRFEPDGGKATLGYAKDLKLIEDVK